MSDLVVFLTVTNLTTTGAAALQFPHTQRCWIPSLQDVMEVFHRIGDVGTGSQSMGQVGEEVDIIASAAFTTNALAIAFVANVEGLKNRICQFKDSWGRTIPRARVNAARAIPTASRGASVGGVPIIVRVDCQMRVERLSDT